MPPPPSLVETFPGCPGQRSQSQGRRRLGRRCRSLGTGPEAHEPRPQHRVRFLGRQPLMPNLSPFCMNWMLPPPGSRRYLRRNPCSPNASTVSAWSTAYPQSASCWITAGSAFSERRLGRLMARNDPAINGRNRICCNNIARFRTTPAAGRKVSRPPVTTSTRATGSQATDSAYAVRSPRFGDLQQFGQGARSQGL
jgi:hypothetical protein